MREWGRRQGELGKHVGGIESHGVPVCHATAARCGGCHGAGGIRVAKGLWGRGGGRDGGCVAKRAAEYRNERSPPIPPITTYHGISSSSRSRGRSRR